MGAPHAAQQQGQGEEVIAGDLQGGIQSQGLAVVPLGSVEVALQLQQGAAVGVGPGAEALGRIAAAVTQGIGANWRAIPNRLATEKAIQQGEGLAITALAVQHLGQLQPGGAMGRYPLQQLAVAPLRLWPGAGFLQGTG